MPDKDTGLIKKYGVARVDGFPVHWCFVLEEKDPFTAPALAALREMIRPLGVADAVYTEMLTRKYREAYTVERTDGKPVTPYYVFEDESPYTPAVLLAYAAAAADAGFAPLAADLVNVASQLLKDNPT